MQEYGLLTAVLQILPILLVSFCFYYNNGFYCLAETQKKNWLLIIWNLTLLLHLKLT